MVESGVGLLSPANPGRNTALSDIHEAAAREEEKGVARGGSSYQSCSSCCRRSERERESWSWRGEYGNRSRERPRDFIARWPSPPLLGCAVGGWLVLARPGCLFWRVATVPCRGRVAPLGRPRRTPCWTGDSRLVSRTFAGFCLSPCRNGDVQSFSTRSGGENVE